jgi:hypothetical protein
MKSRNLYLPLPDDAPTGSERLSGGGNVGTPKGQGEKHGQPKAGREGQKHEQARDGKNSPGRD